MSRFLPLLCIAMAMNASPSVAADSASRSSALDVEMAKLGENAKVNLAEEYKGKVVLLVNVASRCGYTPQYRGLQAIYEKYNEQGLEVVGVPCNQFGGQEPGSALEIQTFCSTKYDVTFDLLEKSNVKSSKPDQCELYQFLTSKETNPEFAGDIKWNFGKFLIDRSGKVVARFGSGDKPESKKVIAAIEKALGE